MNAPHNKSYNAEENGMFRANSWEQIYSYIKSVVFNEKQLSLCYGSWLPKKEVRYIPFSWKKLRNIVKSRKFFMNYQRVTE